MIDQYFSCFQKDSGAACGKSTALPAAELLAAADPRGLAHSTRTGGEFGGAFGLTVRVRGEGGIGSGQMRLPATRACHCVTIANQLLEFVSAIFTDVFKYRHVLVHFTPDWYTAPYGHGSERFLSRDQRERYPGHETTSVQQSQFHRIQKLADVRRRRTVIVHQN